MDQNSLSHHGIMGQKWGIRRYQNPDGSLTDEGRERYGYSPRVTLEIRKDVTKEIQKELRYRNIRWATAEDVAKSEQELKKALSRKHVDYKKVNKLKETIAKKTKDLSDEEIDYGRKVLDANKVANRNTMIGTLLAGPVGAFVSLAFTTTSPEYKASMAAYESLNDTFKKQLKKDLAEKYKTNRNDIQEIIDQQIQWQVETMVNQQMIKQMQLQQNVFANR